MESNSLGVITSQPAVVTSQPAVLITSIVLVTSQSLPVTNQSVVVVTRATSQPLSVTAHSKWQHPFFQFCQDSPYLHRWRERVSAWWSNKKLWSDFQNHRLCHRQYCIIYARSYSVSISAPFVKVQKRSCPRPWYWSPRALFPNYYNRLANFSLPSQLSSQQWKQ